MRYLIFVENEDCGGGCCCCSGPGDPTVTRVLLVPDLVTSKSLHDDFKAWYKSEYVKKDRKGKCEMTRNRQVLAEEWIKGNPDIKIVDAKDFEGVSSGIYW